MEKDTVLKSFLERRKDIEKLLNRNSSSFGNDIPTNDANKPKETNDRRNAKKPMTLPKPINKINKGNAIPVTLSQDEFKESTDDSTSSIYQNSKSLIEAETKSNELGKHSHEELGQLSDPPEPPPKLPPRIIRNDVTQAPSITPRLVHRNMWETVHQDTHFVDKPVDMKYQNSMPKSQMNESRKHSKMEHKHSEMEQDKPSVPDRPLPKPSRISTYVTDLSKSEDQNNDTYQNDGYYEEVDEVDNEVDKYDSECENEPVNYENFHKDGYRGNRDDQLVEIYCDGQSTIQEPNVYNVDLLLIGKTGHGKSALGNSILGRNAFASRSSSTSVTKKVSEEMARYNDRIIKVVDVPGVGDTDMNEEDAKNFVVDNLSYAISINPKGYHAILLVMKFGERFTNENRMTIEVLKKIFGENFVSKYCILVMTHGDQLDRGATFEEWMKKEKGYLADLIKECGNRVALFENRTEDEEKLSSQRNKLLDMVHGLIFQNCRYTNQHFNLAKSSRDAMMLESKKQIIKDESMAEASQILTKLQSIQASVEYNDSIVALENLLLRTSELMKSLQRKDMKTGVLQEMLDHVGSVESTIKDEIKLNKKISDIITKFDKNGKGKSSAFLKHLKSQKEKQCKNSEKKKHKKEKQDDEEEVTKDKTVKGGKKERGNKKDTSKEGNAETHTVTVSVLSDDDTKQCEETVMKQLDRTKSLGVEFKKIKDKNTSNIITAIHSTVCSALKGVFKQGTKQGIKHNELGD